MKKVLILIVVVVFLTSRISVAEYEPLNKFGGTYENGDIYTMSAISDSRYIFSHNGYSYILLDNDGEKSFIYADDSYGKHTLQDFPVDNYFDTSDNRQIIHWLNNDFLNGDKAMTAGRIIDRSIKDYLVEVPWRTEGNGVSTFEPTFGEEYSFNAKLSLISVSEIIKYCDKIGYQTRTNRGTNQSLMILTRTPHNNLTEKLLYYRQNTGSISNCNPVENNYTNYYLRPCFYLNNDYFKNIKLDVDIMGEMIKEMLCENFTYDELCRVYTQQELEIIGFTENKTVLGNPRVLGSNAVGNQITLNIDCYNLLPDTEFLYKWSVSNNVDGEYKEISGEDGRGYIIRLEDRNKYIKGEVTAYNSNTGIVYSYASNISGRVGRKAEMSASIDDITFSSDKVIAEYTLNNNNVASKNFRVFIQAFDSNKKPIGINHTKLKINKGETHFSISVLAENIAFAKVMILGENSSLRPLCAMTSFR